MRLIDADTFKEKLATAAVKKGTVYSAKIASNFCELIDMQPEIQYTPESTEATEAGSDAICCHWYQCQKCGQENIMHGSSYCPDCGRKIMRQKAKKP